MPAPSTATSGAVRGAHRLAARGEQGGVDAAGERLDEHGALVGYVTEAMELAVVGDELGSPAATGRRAEPGLDAGFQITGDEVAVVVAVARVRHLRTAAAKPRAAWPSTGSMATRVPSSSSPTTSCPGTNGNDTTSSKYIEA